MAEVATRYRTVVTFERDQGDPVCVRREIVDSSPSNAAKSAVFRALPEVGRMAWESVVIVMDKL